MSNANPSNSNELVSLGDEPRATEILAESVLKLWEVVNNLTRLRPTKREDFRVTIFGSARIPPDHWVQHPGVPWAPRRITARLQ